MLTQQELQEYLAYDKQSGEFRWLKGRRAGRLAGCFTHYRGYTLIQLRYKQYLAHRLAWLYIYGSWPELQIDHINGDVADNRLVNLREANNAQQQHNSKERSAVGFKGVVQLGNKFMAQIHQRGKTHYLGMYATPEEAHAAYFTKAQELFGEFARAK